MIILNNPLLLFLLISLIKQTKQKQDKPNILIILADDLGTGDIPGYFNSCRVRMPNLQKLVSQSTLFTNAHATPLCAPSRYTLLSGNYQHRGTYPGGAWKLEGANQFKERQRSIASILKKAGYHTSMMGKWHLGGKVPPHGLLDEDTILTHTGHDWIKYPIIQGPQDIGFDSSLISTGGIQAPPYVFFRDGYMQSTLDNIKRWHKGNHTMPLGTSKIEKPGEGAIDWDSTAYNMILVNETKRFLDYHIESHADKPFFTYLALGAVHFPHSPPKQYIDVDMSIETDIAAQYPNEHMDMLGEMDLVVGSVIQALEERQLLKDTLILFTSDNGGLHKSADFHHFSNGPLRGHKGQLYEGGHRVPMILRWDNGRIPKNRQSDALVGINDVFATICDIANIPKPTNQALDSISFKESIYHHHAANEREELGLWRHGLGGAIVTKSYKLIQYDNETKELYHISQDPYERKDLIQDSRQESMITMLTQRLDALTKLKPSVNRYSHLRN